MNIKYTQALNSQYLLNPNGSHEIPIWAIGVDPLLELSINTKKYTNMCPYCENENTP